MKFHVFRCKKDPDYFIVTDAAHVKQVKAAKHLCLAPEDTLEAVGVFAEMGETRVAFDEGLAKRSIIHQGYYRFEAKSFDPVAERPFPMP